jgi:hypothetical protein
LDNDGVSPDAGLISVPGLSIPPVCQQESRGSVSLMSMTTAAIVEEGDDTSTDIAHDSDLELVETD